MSEFLPSGGPIVADPANADAVQALRERGRDNPDIVPFVGSGLSKAFGFPNWEQLLAAGAQRVGERAAVEECLAEHDLERGMAIISAGLEGIAFENFLRSIFAHQIDDAATSWEAVRLLPLLPRGPIVTTNIDRVIELVFDEHGADLEVVIGAKVGRIRTAIEHRESVLIKLHGDYREPSERILTEAEYEAHYGKSSRSKRRSSPFAGILQNLFAGQSFLFLGFGMEARTRELLSVVSKFGALHQHWMLVKRPPEIRVYNELGLSLSRNNVSPLWLDDYEDIPTFLYWLAIESTPPGSAIRESYRQASDGFYVDAFTTCCRAKYLEGFSDKVTSWNLAQLRELAARQVLLNAPKGGIASASRGLLSPTYANAVPAPPDLQGGAPSDALAREFESDGGNTDEDTPMNSVSEVVAWLRGPGTSVLLPSTLALLSAVDYVRNERDFWTPDDTAQRYLRESARAMEYLRESYRGLSTASVRVGEGRSIDITLEPPLDTDAPLMMAVGFSVGAFELFNQVVGDSFLSREARQRAAAIIRQISATRARIGEPTKGVMGAARRFWRNRKFDGAVDDFVAFSRELLVAETVRRIPSVPNWRNL